MSTKKWIVVGSGQRVREAALPVAWTLGGTWDLAGVFSRTPKRLDAVTAEGASRSVDVEPLEALNAARLSGVDLIYVVVAKDAVPAVLKRLAALDPVRTDLLIETPVLLPKHLVHLRHLRGFRAAYVAEDCAYLPCLPAIREAFASGVLGGPPRAAVLSHSAYAYHGVALLKAFLGPRAVTSARKGPLAGGLAWRHFEFAGGALGHVLEPRDYGSGRIAIAGPKGVLADHPLAAKSHVPLAAIVERGCCTGFRAGDHTEHLAAVELALMGTAREGAGLTAWMDGMKRVGLRRMLVDIAAGKGGYPLLEAVDDTLVDYHLTKIGHYRANPFTSARGALAPLTWRALGLAAH